MGDWTTSTVAVLGAGPGGYAAAFRAADLGLDVTLIDLDPNPGGTCLYRGCIPSKALLHVARVITEAQDAAKYGITFGKPKIDLDKVRQATLDVVNKMTSGLGQLGKARKVKYVQGRGFFLDSHTLRIDADDRSRQEMAFDYIILASGSRPAFLSSLMIDSDKVMDSTDALELPDIPEKLLVIGGGYIGLEMATVYQALGSKVSVVELTSGLLPGVDRDLVKPVAQRMERICEAVYLDTKVEHLEETRSGIRARLHGPDVKHAHKNFDRVLVSVGRSPNSSGLGLNHTKVQVNDRGFVEVDAYLRTQDPHIFAIGDVIGEPMLAHKATHEGRVAAEVITGLHTAFEPRAIPAVVFTDPEVAWCGLTETQAKQEEREVNVSRFPWAASGRATTLHRNDGVTKLITDPETDQVLGVGMAGVGAGELIAEGALAVEMGAVATDLALTIHPHPTLSETVMESAELLDGSSTHYYRPKRKQKAER